MIRSVLPYDIRWTSKLLRRDVRNLKAKYTTKIRNKLTSKIPKDSTLYLQTVESEAVTDEYERLQRIIRFLDDTTNTTATTELPSEECLGIRSSATKTTSTMNRDVSQFRMGVQLPQLSHLANSH